MGNAHWKIFLAGLTVPKRVLILHCMSNDRWTSRPLQLEGSSCRSCNRSDATFDLLAYVAVSAREVLVK